MSGVTSNYSNSIRNFTNNYSDSIRNFTNLDALS